MRREPEPAVGSGWQVEVWRDARTATAPFERWLRRCDPYTQAVVDAVLTYLVEPHGLSLLGTEWCRALGDGLFEIRVRQSLQAVRAWSPDGHRRTGGADRRRVLLRLFVTFHGNRVVLLLHGYDKGKDPSDRRQRREIARARRLLAGRRAEP